MGRRKRKLPHIEYVEIGFSHGYRWRIDPQTMTAIEYEKMGGLERASAEVALDDVLEWLQTEQAERRATTEPEEAG